jgi:hypothetical protein
LAANGRGAWVAKQQASVMRFDDKPPRIVLSAKNIRQINWAAAKDRISQLIAARLDHGLNLRAIAGRVKRDFDRISVPDRERHY